MRQVLGKPVGRLARHDVERAGFAKQVACAGDDVEFFHAVEVGVCGLVEFNLDSSVDRLFSSISAYEH